VEVVRAAAMSVAMERRSGIRSIDQGGAEEGGNQTQGKVKLGTTGGEAARLGRGRANKTMAASQPATNRDRQPGPSSPSTGTAGPSDASVPSSSPPPDRRTTRATHGTAQVHGPRQLHHLSLYVVLGSGQK